MRRLNLGRDARDRGAVTIVVAGLLSGLLMSFCVAASVDIGNAMYDRRGLQNGADAVSLAYAADCAQNAASCAPDSGLLNANAGDGHHQLESVCGKGPGLTACGSSDPADLSDCTAPPSWFQKATMNHIEVRTRTEDRGGAHFLPSAFTRSLVGGDGISVRACARAAWGSWCSEQPEGPCPDDVRVRLEDPDRLHGSRDCGVSAWAGAGAGPSPTGMATPPILGRRLRPTRAPSVGCGRRATRFPVATRQAPGGPHLVASPGSPDRMATATP